MQAQPVSFSCLFVRLKRKAGRFARRYRHHRGLALDPLVAVLFCHSIGDKKNRNNRDLARNGAESFHLSNPLENKIRLMDNNLATRAASSSVEQQNGDNEDAHLATLIVKSDPCAVPLSSFTTSVTTLSWTHTSSGWQNAGNGGGVCCADTFLGASGNNNSAAKSGLEKVPLKGTRSTEMLRLY